MAWSHSLSKGGLPVSIRIDFGPAGELRRRGGLLMRMYGLCMGCVIGPMMVCKDLVILDRTRAVQCTFTEDWWRWLNPRWDPSFPSLGLPIVFSVCQRIPRYKGFLGVPVWVSIHTFSRVVQK